MQESNSFNKKENVLHIDKFEKCDTSFIIHINNILTNGFSNTFTSETETKLKPIFDHIIKDSNAFIEIIGYSNCIKYSLDSKILSERKAEFIMEYFIFSGISPQRLTSKGYGYKSYLIDNENTSFKKGTLITCDFISKLKTNATDTLLKMRDSLLIDEANKLIERYEIKILTK